MSLNLNLKSVLKLYESILKPCPKCGIMMTPLGDASANMESYLYCFDCNLECDMTGKQKK